MNEHQAEAIAEALAAAETCKKRAAFCAQLGLTVLAREYDYFAKTMVERVEWQRRAIDPQSSAETENT